MEELNQKINEQVQLEVQKVDILRKNEAYRYRMPHLYNSNINPDRKPGSDLPFSYLRRMANIYPIARACINRRITQITGLSWDITTVDDIQGEDEFESQIKEVKMWLKQPFGHHTRLRELLTIMIDDLLTLDAVSFEIAKTRGGRFMHLVPVDPSTIVLRVTPSGATPEPPMVAYEQIILGQSVAKFTTDQLIYESLNAKSYTPYGMSPLESLILQVEAALRGTLYNLNYFRENNVPEGFVTLPEEVATSKAQVEDWQEWFDALVAGDTQMTHRLKILPNGSEYTAAKKPEDMAFERFEMWILEQTCAVFDIQPQDIGITHNVNRATGEVQHDIGKERGLLPLVNFVKEVVDHVIQDIMGYESLQLVWTNLDPVDEKVEVEIAEKEIKMGALSVDEYREKKGLEPIGLGHYVLSGNEPILVTDFLGGKKTIEVAQTQSNAVGPTSSDDEEDDQEDGIERMVATDLRKWKKCAIADLKADRPARTDFASEHIPDDVRDYVAKGLRMVESPSDVYTLFEKFLDPKLKASYTLLEYAQKIREA